LNNGANGGVLLSHITQNNIQTGQRIKSFSFNYQAANPTTNIGINPSAGNGDPSTKLPRPFLTEVDELDNMGVIVKPYKFGYNDFTQLPPRLSFAQDYWEAQLFVNSSLVANRNPDYNYASVVPGP
jgi:hypothetical protein